MPARHARPPPVHPPCGPCRYRICHGCRNRCAASCARATFRCGARSTIQMPRRHSAGRRYGAMGMLFMAAEYRDEAEACFLNARALAPADRRWLVLPRASVQDEGRHAAVRRRVRAGAHAERATIPLRSSGSARRISIKGRPEAAEPLFARAQSLQPSAVVTRCSGSGARPWRGTEYAQAVLISSRRSRSTAPRRRSSTI